MTQEVDDSGYDQNGDSHLDDTLEAAEDAAEHNQYGHDQGGDDGAADAVGEGQIESEANQCEQGQGDEAQDAAQKHDCLLVHLSSLCVGGLYYFR